MRYIDVDDPRWRMGIAEARIKLMALYPPRKPLIVVLREAKRKRRRRTDREVTP